MPPVEAPGALVQPVTLTRQELFEKVWSTPLTRLAPTYGVHHVRLAQLCDDHEIPRPAVGYWSQKAYGKADPPPELPPVDNPTLEAVRIAPDEPAERARRAPEQEAETTPPPAHAGPASAPQGDSTAPQPAAKLETTPAAPPARLKPIEPGWVTLTRQELYNLVWSEPISLVCQDYGISNVGLAKVCKRHEVPTPPRGY